MLLYYIKSDLKNKGDLREYIVFDVIKIATNILFKDFTNFSQTFMECKKNIFF